MKLVTLNVWGGRVKEPLAAYLEKSADSVDIFCFQEVFKGANDDSAAVVTKEFRQDFKLFENMSILLPNHRGHFCPVLGDMYGLAIFVRQDIEVRETGGLAVYTEERPFRSWADGSDHTRMMQWIKVLPEQGKECLVMNVHGHWAGQSKSDNPARLEQSRRLIAFFRESNCPRILCGDFNLRPDTESVAMIEKSGMRNLVTEHGVTSTRTSFHTREEKFADFIFTSADVQVNGFQVLPDEVSDHAPLFLDFEVK